MTVGKPPQLSQNSITCHQSCLEAVIKRIRSSVSVAIHSTSQLRGSLRPKPIVVLDAAASLINGLARSHNQRPRCCQQREYIATGWLQHRLLSIEGGSTKGVYGSRSSSLPTAEDQRGRRAPSSDGTKARCAVQAINSINS